VRVSHDYLFLILRSGPQDRVSKDGYGNSWFETREDALLSMRV
jgi:hypothetical protein